MVSLSPGLGRLEAPDPQDHKYLMAAVHAPLAQPAPIVTKGWPLFQPHLDQGSTSTCVGHGWKHYRMATPNPRPAAEPPSAFDLYDAATQVDEWTENDHDALRQYGTSVRAAAKVLQSLGVLDNYGWAFDLPSALQYLMVSGPLVIGTNWYSSMFERDGDGFVRIAPNATIAGGHCTCVLGWNQERGYAILVNSWATMDRFKLDGETLERLLREGGECCGAVEVRGR